MKKRKWLYFLQAVAGILAVGLLYFYITGTRVVIDSVDSTEKETYLIDTSDSGVEFQDSLLFNKILGKSLTDLIAFGTVRGQMETEGIYDGNKIIDVTAYNKRYTGISSEYTTVDYKLEDLLKWAGSGFTYTPVHMTASEADEFLSRVTTARKVDFSAGNYSGGTISIFNSDIDSHTTTIDVSGNQWADGENLREETDATVLNNRYHTADGKNIEDYVASWQEYYDLCDNVEKAGTDLLTNYNLYLNYYDTFDAKNTNIRYVIRKTIGTETEIYTNLNLSATKINDITKEFKQNCDKYIFYSPADLTYETNTLIEEESLRYIVNGYEYAYPENLQIWIGVDTTYPCQDSFYQAMEGYNHYLPNSTKYLVAFVIVLLLFMVLFPILTIKTGMYKDENGNSVCRAYKGDNIPEEVMILLFIAVVFILFKVSSVVVNRFWLDSFMKYSFLVVLLMSIIVLPFILWMYYRLIRNIRSRRFIKNSGIIKLVVLLRKSIVLAYDHGTSLLRTVVPFVLLVILNLLVLTNNRKVFITVVIIDVIMCIIISYNAIQRDKILDAINKIKNGDVKCKVEEEHIHGDNLVLAKAVNNIGDGIKNAVETSMKDERMKADLITNVSHDIKTPLTSIINYVDLIKRENVDNEKVKEYIRILDSKSQRLKQLTDDLVEASKISSGNIILNFEKINVTELMNQMIGEFLEKFKQKDITPVLNCEQKSLMIRADSRRIYRILENLFNNIFKYAMPGTRVYIDVTEIKEASIKNNKDENMDVDGGKVQIAVKNISAQAINVNASELTERFMRGEESRTTEGSGLGLSIAKNLTEIQNGKFEIDLDGDLFKIILTFPKMK